MEISIDAVISEYQAEIARLTHELVLARAQLKLVLDAGEVRDEESKE